MRRSSLLATWVTRGDDLLPDDSPHAFDAHPNDVPRHRHKVHSRIFRGMPWARRSSCKLPPPLSTVRDTAMTQAQPRSANYLEKLVEFHPLARKRSPFPGISFIEAVSSNYCTYFDGRGMYPSTPALMDS